MQQNFTWVAVSASGLTLNLAARRSHSMHHLHAAADDMVKAATRCPSSDSAVLAPDERSSGWDKGHGHPYFGPNDQEMTCSS